MLTGDVPSFRLPQTLRKIEALIDWNRAWWLYYGYYGASKYSKEPYGIILVIK